jgi:hypothetical protein
MQQPPMQAWVVILFVVESDSLFEKGWIQRAS